MIKIDKRKVKAVRNQVFAIGIVTVTIGLFISLVSVGAMTFSAKISDNVLQLKTIGDWLIVSLLIASIVFTNVYLFFAFKNRKRYLVNPLGIIACIFQNELFLLSIIPLVVLGHKTNAENVQKVVWNTKLFYVSSVFILVLGIILLIVLLREYLKKSNWWIFLILIPHMMIGWVLKADHQGFILFIHSSDFSYQKVSKMFIDTHIGLLSINPSWFKCLAGMILILILVIGLIIYEFLWKKTKSWRIKYD